jgi:hypothetical protein
MFSPSANKRSWGFRFSLADALALLVLAAATLTLHRNGNPLWWLALFVGGHFFLFCNVFRVSRRRELTWAGLLLVNAGFWIFRNPLNWLHVVACQIPASIAVIVSEIRSSTYHGILADRINPKLDYFLNGDIP